MCENCKSLFDLKSNLPYLIPCGHTICQKCLFALEFKNNKMKCPIDLLTYETIREKIPNIIIATPGRFADIQEKEKLSFSNLELPSTGTLLNSIVPLLCISNVSVLV